MQTPIRAIIDTSALSHNLARVRSFAPGSKVVAVIKANGYGHDIETVAQALSGADAFAVARLEEALTLRAAGARHRILVLEGALSPGQQTVAAREQLDLMVHSFEQVRMLEERIGGEAIRVWVKIDTGMNRRGFRLEEGGEARARLSRVAGVAPEPTLLTHLVSSEDVDSPRTQVQLDAFAAATRGIVGERSIANSAGIIAWPASRADWVRAGLMLYGISPFAQGAGADLGLRPVMTFEAGVISVRFARAGETVGYGGTWRAERDSRIAVVSAGYGDGYPRGAPTGTPVLVNGQIAPLVGRVSMDMITVDVTDLPGVACGDPAELWGPALPVEEIARRAGTIPYELTCRVTARVPRVVR